MATVEADLLNLLQNGPHDIELIVTKGNFCRVVSAHKLILRIWSPVFAGLLEDENLKELEILEISPSTMSAFINYLYDSKTDLEKNKHDIPFILDVYKAAKRYQVKSLLLYCCNIFDSAAPNSKNVFELIDAAVIIGSDCLRNRCSTILKTETESVLNSREIEDFTESMVLSLLRLPSLELSCECDLIEWVFKWSECQLLLQPNCTPREIINPLLPYFNFTALKTDQFSTLVYNHRKFFNEVECFYIFMNISIPESTVLPEWYDVSRNSRNYKKPLRIYSNVAMRGYFEPEEFNFTTGTNLGVVNDITPSLNTSSTSAVDIDSPDSEHISNQSPDVAQTCVGSVDCGTSATAVNSSESSSDDSSVSNDNTSCSLSPFSSSAMEVDDCNVEKAIVDINKESACLNVEYSLNETIDVVSSAIDDCEQPLIETVDCASTSNTDSVVKVVDPNLSAMMLANVSQLISSSDDTSLTEPLENEAVASSNNDLSETNSEEIRRKVSSCLSTGNSWDDLEPTASQRKKINKKKIKKFYLLPENKSLPPIGIWDPLFESFVSCGDYRSLRIGVQKQLFCLAV